MAANYTLHIIDRESYVGGYQHISILVYIFQTAMTIEVCKLDIGLERT